MNTIGNLALAHPATRAFTDTQPLDNGERGFMDLDSTVHAILDRANVGGDNKSIYGLDLPRSTYDLFRTSRGTGVTA
ncbi:hypothetical protein [Achromobacter aloeverae]|uniref:Uncharacterized protein n=1 Tax=Achromobacter aloeverae TaxID=1750518 RepID=A0A4Q1HJ54_9BURK|nr:hypothetical protein [Achromobacter aloeverae]RXN88127.1 hypothetical protein C7R54_16325 [Achromobacter aloeverae]